MSPSSRSSSIASLICMAHVSTGIKQHLMITYEILLESTPGTTERALSIVPVETPSLLPACICMALTISRFKGDNLSNWANGAGLLDCGAYADGLPLLLTIYWPSWPGMGGWKGGLTAAKWHKNAYTYGPSSCNLSYKCYFQRMIFYLVWTCCGSNVRCIQIALVVERFQATHDTNHGLLSIEQTMRISIRTRSIWRTLYFSKCLERLPSRSPSNVAPLFGLFRHQ